MPASLRSRLAEAKGSVKSLCQEVAGKLSHPELTGAGRRDGSALGSRGAESRWRGRLVGVPGRQVWSEVRLWRTGGGWVGDSSSRGEARGPVERLALLRVLEDTSVGTEAAVLLGGAGPRGLRGLRDREPPGRSGGRRRDLLWCGHENQKMSLLSAQCWPTLLFINSPLPLWASAFRSILNSGHWETAASSLLCSPSQYPAHLSFSRVRRASKQRVFLFPRHKD